MNELPPESLDRLSALPQELSSPVTPSSATAVEPVAPSGLLADQGSQSVQARMEYLWKVHEYTNEYIRFADSKAAILLAASGGILGWLWSVQASHGDAAPKSPAFWLAWIAMSFLLAAAIAGALVIAPRLNTKQVAGFLYWGSIVEHQSREAFITALKTKRPVELQEHLANHLFELAGIASAKYHGLARGIWLGLAGGVAAVLSAII